MQRSESQQGLIFIRDETAPPEPQFPRVANFVKLNLFLPFSFSSVCGGSKSGNFIKRDFGADLLFDRSTNSPKQDNNQTCLPCFQTCFYCLLVFQTSLIIDIRRWGWQADDGVSKATRKPFSNLSRQDKSASFINYS